MAKTKHDNSGPSPSILTSVLISLGSLLIALLVIEVAFRAFSAFSTPAPSWSDRPNWYMKAEQSPTLKDYYYSKDKEENVFRIIVLGDSFSFAPFMQFDDAFPKRLERMLNVNDSDTAVEVLNFGVPGFSTSHEVKALKEALSYHPDLVLLQVTLNDPQQKPYTPTGLREDNPFTQNRDSSSTGMLRHWKSLQFIFQRLRNTATHDAYVEYYFELFEKKENWRLFERSFHRIHRLCDKNSVQLGVVLFPLFGLPLDEDYPFHPLHEKVRGITEKLSLPTLDLFSTFEDIPLSRLQVIPGQDFHPNEIGHRLAAESMYDWLKAEGLIRKDLLIQHRYPRREGILFNKEYALEP